MLRKKYMRAARAAVLVSLALAFLFLVLPSLRRDSSENASFSDSDSDNDNDKSVYPDHKKAVSRQRSLDHFADDPGLQLPRLIESIHDRGVDISDLRIAILEHTDWHDGGFSSVSEIVLSGRIDADRTIEVIGPIARLLQELGLQFDIYRELYLLCVSQWGLEGRIRMWMRTQRVAVVLPVPIRSDLIGASCYVLDGYGPETRPQEMDHCL